MATLGKRNLLRAVRQADAGLYLDAQELGEILLPRRYLPPDLQRDQLLDVFLYRDSEDRLVATTEQPLACVGEFACMQVKDVNEGAGAFLDWGLAKDLLLPFREQGSPVRVGQRVVVAVCMDEKTDRIIASARIDRHFSREMPALKAGQQVRALVWGKTPLGYNAIVENAFRGLLYHSSLATPLKNGQLLQCYVREVREDRKIDLSLDAAGYARVGPLTEQVLQALRSAGGQLDLDDDSSPAAVRQRFGVSKKAFKQALGALYRDRKITFAKPGIRLSGAATETA